MYTNQIKILYFQFADSLDENYSQTPHYFLNPAINARVSLPRINLSV